MKISELARVSGLPVATIKLYIREGLLARGSVTARTQAEYTNSHQKRLALITSLRSIQGLPLMKIAEILAVIDSPVPADITQATGAAVAALPPYMDDDVEEPVRARVVLESADMPYEPSFPATHQLDRALRALDSAGLSTSHEVLATYLRAARDIARDELAALDNMELGPAVEYAVLGTALYEPLLLALRRLAHHEYLTCPPGGRPIQPRENLISKAKQANRGDRSEQAPHDEDGDSH